MHLKTGPKKVDEVSLLSAAYSYDENTFNLRIVDRGQCGMSIQQLLMMKNKFPNDSTISSFYPVHNMF